MSNNKTNNFCAYKYSSIEIEKFQYPNKKPKWNIFQKAYKSGHFNSILEF